MKAIVLAGGRGSRLGALTSDKPKPMIEVLGKPALEHLICSAAEAGIGEFIINIGYRGEQIQEYFQDGKSLGVRIRYSTAAGNGPEEAILAARGLVEEPEICCLCGDSVILASELKRMLRYQKDTDSAATFTLEEGDPSSEKRVRVQDDNVLSYSRSYPDPVLVYNLLMKTCFLDELAKRVQGRDDKAFCYAMDEMVQGYKVSAIRLGFINLNTPADIERAERLLRGSE